MLRHEKKNNGPSARKNRLRDLGLVAVLSLAWSVPAVATGSNVSGPAGIPAVPAGVVTQSTDYLLPFMGGCAQEYDLGIDLATDAALLADGVGLGLNAVGAAADVVGLVASEVAAGAEAVEFGVMGVEMIAGAAGTITLVILGAGVGLAGAAAETLAASSGVQTLALGAQIVGAGSTVLGVASEAVGLGFAVDAQVMTHYQHSLSNCDQQFTGTVTVDAGGVNVTGGSYFHDDVGVDADVNVSGTVNANQVHASQGISAHSGAIWLGDPNGTSYSDGITLGGGALSGAGTGGAQATTGHVTAIAIGNGANASSFGSTALGTAANADAEYATAIGYAAVADAAEATAVGIGAQANGVASLASGFAAVAAANRAVALGPNSYAHGYGSVAVGSFAVADEDFGIAMGSGAITGSGISIGSDAGVQGDAGVAVGASARAYEDTDTALGNGATVNAANGTAVGAGTIITGLSDNGVIVGQGSSIGGVNVLGSDNVTIVGQNINIADGIDNIVAMGTGASVSATGGTALGYGASSVGTNSMALGVGAMAALDNQQVFGTMNETYQMPGLTSSLSRDRQLTRLELPTSDGFGNLASDGGRTFRAIARAQAGIALGYALDAPQLTQNENFAVGVGYGYNDGDGTAIGFNAIGVLHRGVFSDTDRLAFSVGIGIGQSEFYDYNESTIAGAGKLQLSW